ncbi:FecCD family ABC transporter permease [Shimia sp.]|uniref:FecCD family ABC transporter permease n=1 Tax=Shimia sp. TaxID=1954381 RepID=UPI003B8AB97F
MSDQVTSAQTGAVSDLMQAYNRRIAKRLLLILLAFVALAVLIICDVITGPANLSFGRTLEVILNRADATPKELVIIWKLRLPVALMAVFVGAMLGVAGAEMQTILNNPLADPFTLGLSSAASFGAALAIVLGWSVVPGVGGLFVTVNAFVFALGASFFLYIFTKIRGVSPEAMILVGIAMLFTFNALLAFLQYGASEMQLAQLIFWQLGSLSRATWEKVAICAIVLGVLLPWFYSRSWSLTALRMGEDKAAALGVNVGLLRVSILAGVSLLAAVAVSFVGAIAFVGLVGPHIARMIVGEDQRGFLPLSALCGAVILSGTSIASKAITPGIVYPIGMITSLIGIPFFILLILGQRKRHWQ